MTKEIADIADRIAAATDLLEAIVADRGLLIHVDTETRVRLMKAAGRASKPTRDDERVLNRAFRKRKKKAARAEDIQLLSRSGIRIKRGHDLFHTPRLRAPDELDRLGCTERSPGHLHTSVRCYICKEHYKEVHFFYDSMCPSCATLNWEKRHQTADLTGRVGLLTGGRVKIGFQIAMLLLRSGATLIVTTRFPRDAAARFAREEDYDSFCERLQIHGLDLRHTPSVEAFCTHLCQTLPKLDFIINNACQTVRRPSGFYQHLLDAEDASSHALSERALVFLRSHDALRAKGAAVLASVGATEPVGLTDSATLSQLALLDEDKGRDIGLFPVGALDADRQQVDLREMNSWRLKLADVSSVEFLEVQLVNAVAPFVLNARLKPLLKAVPTNDAHIVNVSAVEGQFYRVYKSDRHPHTNMAKAALNMMTRTAAADYVQHGIHMNSVDTGWVTDEDPAQIAEMKREEHDFHAPLDIVDGAARVVDPLFSGLNSGEHVWGQFLKNYRSTDW